MNTRYSYAPYISELITLTFFAVKKIEWLMASVS